MIKDFKIFETWNDGKIDKSIFISGRAKHNPKVLNGNTIEYTTDDKKYFAKITRLSEGKYICKVYKKSKKGKKKRIRKNTKKTLKTAHNYIRESLNDLLDKKKKSREGDKDEDYNDEKLDSFERDLSREIEKRPSMFDSDINPRRRRRTVIRRYV